MTREEKNLLELLKAKCICVWGRYVNDSNYFEEKVEKVKNVNNFEDVFYLINMFDVDNQSTLYNLLTQKEKEMYRKHFSIFAI